MAFGWQLGAIQTNKKQTESVKFQSSFLYITDMIETFEIKDSEIGCSVKVFLTPSTIDRSVHESLTDLQILVTRGLGTVTEWQ